MTPFFLLQSSTSCLRASRRLRRYVAPLIPLLIIALSGSSWAQSITTPPPAQPSQGVSADQDRLTRTGLVTVGIGAPSLLHGAVGVFVTPRILVELSAGFHAFNLLTGVRAEMHLLGEGPQPRHALTVAIGGFLNPLLPIDEWAVAPVDHIGLGGELLLGWRLLTNGGFLMRARTGAIVYSHSHGLEVGSNLRFSIGWAW